MCMYMLHVTCCRTCAAACCRGGVHEHTVDLCGTAVLCTHQTSESERLLEFIRQFFILVAIIGPALAHLSVKSGPRACGPVDRVCELVREIVPFWVRPEATAPTHEVFLSPVHLLVTRAPLHVIACRHRQQHSESVALFSYSVSSRSHVRGPATAMGSTRAPPCLQR